MPPMEVRLRQDAHTVTPSAVTNTAALIPSACQKYSPTKRHAWSKLPWVVVLENAAYEAIRSTPRHRAMAYAAKFGVRNPVANPAADIENERQFRAVARNSPVVTG